VKNTKKYLVLLLAFVLVVSVSACASGTSSSTGEESSAKNAGSGEKFELNFVSWDTNPTTQEIFQMAKKNFEAKHPNITVKIDATQYDNYMTKLQTQIAAGDPPDIMQIGERDFRRYMVKGIISDLIPYAKQDNANLDDLNKNVMNTVMVDGKLPVIPLAPTAMAIYYNKKLFDQAGVPYPQDNWTWEDFVDTAKKLTKVQDGKTVQFGALLPTSKDWVEPLVISRGGSYLSADGSTVKGFLDGPKSVEAYKWYIDLFRVAKIAPTPAQTNSMAGVDLFATGKVAMQYTGPWPLENLKKNPDMKFGVVGLPHFKDGKRVNFMYAAGYGISSKSKHAKEAWEFIRELTFPDTPAGKEWAKWGPASFTSLAKESQQDKDPYMSVFLNEMNYIQKSAFYMNPYWGAVGDKYINPAIEKMILAGTDVQQTLSDAADQIAKELKDQSAAK
jgi:multiple sugar transport system substrate-binding protein